MICNLSLASLLLPFHGQEYLLFGFLKIISSMIVTPINCLWKIIMCVVFLQQVRKRPLNKKEVSRKEDDIVTVCDKALLSVHEPKLKVLHISASITMLIIFFFPV